MFFRASTVITLVGGTIFLMWLGEQITARGVGNGISLIIFAGIVATNCRRPSPHFSNRAATAATTCWSSAVLGWTIASDWLCIVFTLNVPTGE